MSFYNAEESFFLDALVSTTRPIVQIVPLTDTEVFQYLDAHPEALHKYFAERDGFVWSFIKTNSQGLPGVEATPAKVGTVTEGDAAFDSLFDDELSALAMPEVTDEQAAALEGDGDEGDNLPESELVSSLWEGTPFQNLSSSPPPSPPSSPSPPSPPPSSLPPPPPPPPPQSSSSAPPQKSSRKWTSGEEDSCIRHMLAIHQEGQIQGEGRFREAQRRMKEIDGFERNGSTAVKNFWNRVGRARSQFDERKNKKAPLATSQQGKPSKSSSSQSPERAVSSPTPTSSLPPQRRPRKANPDPGSDDGQEHSTPEASNETKPATNSCKRHRDDSEDEWEPDQSTLNAIAKGLRTPKKARTQY